MSVQPQNVNHPATVAAFPPALPTLLDWLLLCLPAGRVLAVSDALAGRYAAAARRRLQRRAARHIQRDECSAVASLIVAGEWRRLDALMDALEVPCVTTR